MSVISPEADGGQIYLNVVTVLCYSKDSTDTKRGFVGAKVFYREHTFASPKHSFRTCGGFEA